MQAAVSVSTPLSVAGLAIAVLYLLYASVLRQKLAPLFAADTFKLLNQVLRYVFYLALTALVLGIGSYTAVTLCKDTNFCRTASVDKARLESDIQQFLVQGYYFDALKTAEQLVAADPGNAKAHRLKGNALYRMKNYSAALLAFDKALELQPDMAEASFNKASALLKIGDYASAEDIFSRLAEANTGDYAARFNLAETQLLMRKFDGARANYAIVHKGSPKHRGGSALGLGIAAALSQDRPNSMAIALQRFGEAVCVDPKLRALFSGIAVEDGTQRFDTYLEFVGELKAKRIPSFERFLLDLQQGKLACSNSVI